MQALEPSFAAARAVGPNHSRSAAVNALCAIMDAEADFLLGSMQIEGWSRFIARGQSEESYPARDVIWKKFGLKLHGDCGRLVGLATGCPPTSVETKLRTIAILGQLFSFHHRRNNALAELGWPDFYGKRLERLKSVLREQTRAILNGLAR